MWFEVMVGIATFSFCIFFILLFIPFCIYCAVCFFESNAREQVFSTIPFI